MEVARNYSEKYFYEHNWSSSSAGAPDTWPQPVRFAISLLLSSNMPSMLCWGEERICIYNHHLRKFLQPSALSESMIGEPVSKVWPGISEEVESVFATGKSTWSDYATVATMHENVRWAGGCNPLFDEAGMIAAVWISGIVQRVDDADRQHADNGRGESLTNPHNALVAENGSSHKQLEYSQEKARLAIASAELGTYEVDMITGEMETDDRFNRIFGFDHCVPRSEFARRIHPDDQPGRVQAHREAVLTGHLRYEARVLWPDEGVHWVRVRGTMFYDLEKKPRRILGVVQDITDQKLFAEELGKQVAARTSELAEANSRLQRSNADLEQFAYIASHDLQEPLRKVITYTNLVQNGIAEKDIRSQNYIYKILHSAKRMSTLIKNVLTFSQLSGERDGFGQVNVETTFQDIINDYELLIEQVNATVTFSGLPVIEANAVQIRQLFTNLLSNSLKFAKPDTDVLVTLTATQMTKEEVLRHPTLSPETQYYQFIFSDNGIGFSNEYADKIFQIFQRLHSKSEYAGTGIGLAMCRKIVDNHQGLIYASAVQNQGAAFHIILPVHRPGGDVA